MHQTFKAALLSCLLGVSSAAAAQDAPAKAGQPPPEQPMILVTSVVPGARSPEGNYAGAVVQFDLMNAELQKSLAGQSTRLVIDIDCAAEKIRARNMIVYKEPKEGGAATEVRIKDDWESYQGGAYLADVARSICHQDGKAGPAGATTVARSPMPPVAAVPETATRSRQGAVIQFVSSSSEAEVRRDIARLRTIVGRDLGQTAFSIQTATVGGLKHYRGRLGVFESNVEAEKFCARIIGAKLPCLVMKQP